MKKKILAIVLIILFTSLGIAHSGEFEDAVDAHNRGDYSEALNTFKSLAEQGDAKSQVTLGFMYQEGYGVPQDYTAAMKWYRKAADQGDAKAQAGLGTMYVKGQGVPEDLEVAAKWFHKAADQGFPEAQVTLAAMYAGGIGVIESPSAAIEWFYKAGKSFLENGDREMALTAYDEIQNIHPGHFLGEKLYKALYP